MPPVGSIRKKALDACCGFPSRSWDASWARVEQYVDSNPSASHWKRLSGANPNVCEDRILPVEPTLKNGPNPQCSNGGWRLAPRTSFPWPQSPAASRRCPRIDHQGTPGARRSTGGHWDARERCREAKGTGSFAGQDASRVVRIPPRPAQFQSVNRPAIGSIPLRGTLDTALSGDETHVRRVPLWGPSGHDKAKDLVNRYGERNTEIRNRL